MSVNPLRSYSSVVKESPISLKRRLLNLIHDGDHRKLDDLLCHSQYASELLKCLWNNSSNGQSYSLLMIAALNGNDPIIHAIIERSKSSSNVIELQGRILNNDGELVDGVTALWCALERSHFNSARLLIEQGKAKLGSDLEPSWFLNAAGRGRLDIVKFFIDHHYVNINESKNEEGNTALSMAAMKGHLEMVQQLCTMDALPSLENNAQKTAIQLALENEKPEIVDYLLNYEHSNRAFDDVELVIAKHILSSHQNSDYNKYEWVIHTLENTLRKRKMLNTEKLIRDPMIVYKFEQECQSVEDLNRIQHNHDRLRLEALMIQERILLIRRDERLVKCLLDEATILVENYELQAALHFMHHIYCIAHQMNSMNYYRDYFWLFYKIFSSNRSIPIDEFWELHCKIYEPSEMKTIDSTTRDLSYLLACQAKVDPPDVSLILKTLKLEDENVANIYYHGSWAQGTCTPTSDQDLIIVTRVHQRSTCFYSEFDYFHTFELHKLFNKYDVCVYSIENFKILLQKNYLLCVQCLFLPNEFKLKEEIDFRKIYLEEFYNPARIKKVAFYEMLYSFNLLSSERERSCRSSRPENQDNTREDFIFKNLFHGLRFLDLAEQLIHKKSITDFTRVAHLLQQMKNIRSEVKDETSKIQAVLEFVRATSSQLKLALRARWPDDVIKGAFVMNLIFTEKSNRRRIVEALEEKCRNSKYQMAIISMTDVKSKGSIQHITVSSLYHGESPSIIQEILTDVNRDFKDFHLSNIIIKALLTNEGIPKTEMDRTLFWDGQVSYFELHYLVGTTGKEYDENLFTSVERKWMGRMSILSQSSTPYVIKQVDKMKLRYMVRKTLLNGGLEDVLVVDKENQRYLGRSQPVDSLLFSHSGFVIYDKNATF